MKKRKPSEEGFPGKRIKRKKGAEGRN